ncbi:MAG: methyltransferase domain-containing protein [Treponema sp.]|nr:class I SAM-dependent methyltransferase [Spirochaetia bacterium]MDD7014326.1 methyltransferase domain-containing protein [Spirochaetales bacterium]MDY4901920.1 methyltransferase domain-containing protein [Treponema sp.]
MENIQNIIEYYDELFPVSESQKDFFKNFTTDFLQPLKYLRINCRTGVFENYLAKEGIDVTGVDSCAEILHSANLKKHSQFESIRFFQMKYEDIARYLGKGFYNVIACLNSSIVFFKDLNLIEKFFTDAKKLLTEKGKLVLELYNFSNYKGKSMIQLPVRESLRVKLFSEISATGKRENEFVLAQNLETGNGRLLQIMNNVPVCLIFPDEIKELAKKAGFKNTEFYADYKKSPFSSDSQKLVAVLSL